PRADCRAEERACHRRRHVTIRPILAVRFVSRAAPCGCWGEFMPRRDLTWKNGLLPLRRLLRLGTPLALTLAGPQTHGQTSFQGLGFLSGGLFSTAIGVNADGTVVAGQSNSSSNPFQGVRWVNSTPTGLGWLPTYTIDSAATGINSNGTVLVGWSQNIS